MIDFTVFKEYFAGVFQTPPEKSRIDSLLAYLNECEQRAKNLEKRIVELEGINIALARKIKLPNPFDLKIFEDVEHMGIDQLVVLAVLFESSTIIDIKVLSAKTGLHETALKTGLLPEMQEATLLRMFTDPAGILQVEIAPKGQVAVMVERERLRKWSG